MKSIYRDRRLHFPHEPEDREAYTGEYLEYRKALGNRMARPLAALATGVWLWFGLVMDPKLHPGFPGLLYFRLGLSLLGAVALALTYTESFGKKGLTLLHVLYAYTIFSCAFFTGRLADDPNYVSGYQIAVLVCPFLPFRFRTVLGYYLASVLVFCGAVIGYRPEITGTAAQYALGNVAVAYILGILFSHFLGRYRFNNCINDLRHDLSYHRLHQIIEFLPDATFVIDNQGRLIAWNRAVEELTGVPAERMIGKGNYEYALPFYGERRPVMIDLVITEDDSLDHMYAYVKRDADRFESESFIPHLKPGGAYLYNTARTLYGADGRIIGAIESIRDITDQKLAERALEESRRQLAEVIDFLPDAAFVIDREEKVLLWNRGMEELTGIRAGEMVGKGNEVYAIPFYGEPRPLLANMALHWSDGYENGYISIKRREDGVLISESFHPNLKGGIFLSGTARVLYDSEGEAAGAIESLRDISEVKAEEKESRRARRAAEEASSAKSHFLASMSHELRTPLNAILGYSQILRRSPNLTEDQRDGLAIVHQSGAHLLTLINDVLDFSRIEAGKLRLDPMEVDLGLFLESIVGIMEIGARQKDLEFHFEPATDLPPFVSLDEKRMRQVLLNLLSNAVKYTVAGRVRFRVSRVDPAGSGAGSGSRATLRFEVADTGVGISEEQLEKIFDPFEQAGREKIEAGGAGLGLAISKQLLDLMGGAMEVESAPGKGSLFRFEVEVPIRRGGGRRKVDVLDTITGYRGRRRKILVTDDNEANRKVIVMMLTSLGFEVVCAEDGKEAVAAAARERPDLILMDLIMPELDGFEATKQLRSLESVGDIPVIAVSASHIDTDQKEAEKEGFNGFLPKPIHDGRLIEKIEALLGVEWIHKNRSAGDDGLQNPPEREIIPPPLEDLDAIYELAVLGKMKPIREKADRLRRLDGRYKAFSDKLTELAKSFEDKRIAALIKAFLEKEPP